MNPSPPVKPGVVAQYPPDRRYDEPSHLDQNEDPELTDCQSDTSDDDRCQHQDLTPRQLEDGFCQAQPSGNPARGIMTAGSCTSDSASESGSSAKGMRATAVQIEVREAEDCPLERNGLDPSPLPPKKGSRLYRFARWNFGSVYRRVFCLSFFGNIAALAVLIAHNFVKDTKFTYHQASLAVTANLLAAIVVRNEHVVNAMFWVFGTWSSRMPLAVRRLVAKVYSYGGIHSGCATAATFWYVAYLVLMTLDFSQADDREGLPALTGYVYFISYLILVLLVSMLITAHPHLRRTLHNWFEGVHRFMGWLAVLLFWAQVLLLTAESAHESAGHFGRALLVSPNFWMLVVITLLIIYPWTRLRLREVHAEVLSQHCVKLNFNYRDVYYGQAVRLTDAPLKETHAFGVIPHPYAPKPIVHCMGCNCEKLASGMDSTNTSMVKLLPKETTSGLSHAGEKGFSVIVSNAGDWTKKIIQNPPKKIYTRGTPQFGVMRIAGLFEPCIIVATGSGIAPCLSLFVQRPEHPVRIIWSTKSPVETYGQQVMDLLLATDPRAVIIDTSKGGPKTRRPDLVKIAYRVWEQSKGESPSDYGNMQGRRNTTGRSKSVGQCEAVVIISNQRLTEKVVYGLESRGVPAYGALFDS
ncbi:putative NRPS-like enzyme [Podospora australis]|uniref:NRPS-like enzyme n=1 Tax=Podospora australis TaxID=1536484 RepID=A0AAN7AH00_9PEZI|nr:putative NRPS-like enzyme [Podospora australis]